MGIGVEVWVEGDGCRVWWGGVARTPSKVIFLNCVFCNNYYSHLAIIMKMKSHTDMCRGWGWRKAQRDGVAGMV